MEITLVELEQIRPPGHTRAQARARERNIARLTLGVTGVECLFVGPPQVAIADQRFIAAFGESFLVQLTQLTPPGWAISSLEAYANGAANVFLRQKQDPVGASAHLFFRVRA